MPAFTSASGAVSVAPLDLITSASFDAGIGEAGEQIDGAEANRGLEHLQRLLDSINAQRPLVFSHNFLLFNLTPNHGPHTIGPGGDFQQAVRPVDVLSASFVLDGSSANPVDLPINCSRDDAWWAANPLKSLTSSIITDLYYDAASPLGNLNFFPISTVGAPVRLEVWNSLPQAIDFTTKLGFVQGYWDYIVTTLAIRLCLGLKQPDPALVAMQREALRVILANNDPAPRIDTNSGMPGSPNAGRPDFNFLTGMRE